MKRHMICAAAIAALAACSGGGETEGEQQETVEEEAAAQLPNGVPAYGEFDPATGVEREETEGTRHEIAYLSQGSVADIFGFYRDHYRDAGYELYEGGLTFVAEDRDYGGYVQLFDQGERLMVHVSPNVGSGQYDLAETIGDGFPAYPGVAEDEYDVNPRSNGSRLVIFRIPNSPEAAMEVLDFYREAGREAGFEERTLSLLARSQAERVKVAVYDIDDGAERRVVATRTDLTQD